RVAPRRPDQRLGLAAEERQLGPPLLLQTSGLLLRRDPARRLFQPLPRFLRMPLALVGHGEEEEVEARTAPWVGSDRLVEPLDRLLEATGAVEEHSEGVEMVVIALSRHRLLRQR